MAANDFFRDRNCSVTPSGRPATRARKAAMLLSNNQHPGSLQLLASKPKPTQIMSLEECRDARPPLPMEQIQTPSPCTYNYFTSFFCGNRRPLSTRTSCIPHCSSFASSTISSSSRSTDSSSKKSLELLSNNLWIHKTAGKHQKRPDACTYSLPKLIGSNTSSTKSSPSYSMGGNAGTRIYITDSPSPNAYDVSIANRVKFKTLPAYSIHPQHRGKRRPVSTPGPAHYHPQANCVLRQYPAFSFRTKNQ
ncbi:PREDICTED: uncharacterized protein LOC100636881 isoform X1 [Amphimedon queenslandica]|uniref:Uncharacterized protein n=1 Tax=Amphimedon queenslandica TaxID=400682 RepID=A0A1X7U561_AMPQE|nr:PREDICTED: uncharacterized protein LOC100636881 isoform X1 [Amphimedon queenslandica]|eukprot:XP_003389020.1 PREDICTED: uncharacterized protein LOC100636881 isoform X1 [Amphimedon queenslandica]